MLQTRPNEYIEAFEQGAKAALKLFLLNENIEPIQVILKRIDRSRTYSRYFIESIVPFGRMFAIADF